MKRIAAALATLIPFACAQAQSTVTIYGIIDLAATLGSGGAGAPNVKRLDSGVGPGSRIGFKGSEDLGSGLSAIFDMQMGLNADTGTLGQGGLAFGRQIYVGLASTSGWRLTAGRQYSPAELALFDTDTMLQIYWGSTSGTGIGTQQSPKSTAGMGCHGYSARINNSVQGSYSAAGFTGKLLVGAGEENEEGSGRFIGPSLAYNNGPLMLTAAYSRFRQCAVDIAAGAAPAWQSEVVAGGTYDFGFMKLSAGYYDYNPSESNKALAPTTAQDNRYFWLGTRVPIGVSSVIVQVTRETQKQVADEGRATVLGIAYEYALSKRTRTYISAAKVWNNATAQFGLVGGTAVQNASKLGADPRALSVGVMHYF